MSEEPWCRKVFMIFLMAAWKRIYVYAASFVGRKEGNSYGVEKEF